MDINKINTLRFQAENLIRIEKNKSSNTAAKIDALYGVSNITANISQWIQHININIFSKLLYSVLNTITWGSWKLSLGKKVAQLFLDHYPDTSLASGISAKIQPVSTQNIGRRPLTQSIQISPNKRAGWKDALTGASYNS